MYIIIWHIYKKNRERPTKKVIYQIDFNYIPCIGYFRETYRSLTTFNIPKWFLFDIPNCVSQAAIVWPSLYGCYLLVNVEAKQRAAHSRGIHKLLFSRKLKKSVHKSCCAMLFNHRYSAKFLFYFFKDLCKFSMQF